MQIPRDAQYVLEDDDFEKLDSKIGELTASFADNRDYSQVARAIGQRTVAYLCPHQGVAKSWPPCRVRKESEDLTEALRTTARFLAKRIPSPYMNCLQLPPPCKIV